MALTAIGASLIGAGISAAGNVASSAAGNVRSQKKWEKRQNYLERQQQRAEQRQFDYNKQLQDYAYEKNLEQWNLENAYNAPTAQMQRLMGAGLNPNLIYGDGGAAMAANSPTLQIGDVGSGTSNVAPYSADNFGGAFDYVGAAGLAIQSRLADAEIEKKNAETLGLLSDADFKNASFNLRLEDLAEGIANKVAGTENLQADTTGKEIANDTNLKLQPTKIAQAEQDLENTKKQGWNLDKMGKLLDSQVRKTKLEGDLLKVQKRIADLDEKIKKVDASNAQELMDLRKQRENSAIRLANNQADLVQKEWSYYDSKTRAELALSAAETLNRKAFAGLADSRKGYQDFVNKMNEILLDPTKETDAKTYWSALLLKNLDETSFMDVLKYVTDVVSDDSSSAGSDEKKNDSVKLNDSDLQKVAAHMYKWYNDHQSATDAEKAAERQRFIDEMLGN